MTRDGRKAALKAALKREYKENPPAMGVYAITGSGDGMTYLGAAKDVRARLNRHRFALRRGNHPESALQRTWTAAGETGLRFETLDTLEHDPEKGADPDEELALLLAMWQDRLTRTGAVVVLL